MLLLDRSGSMEGWKMVAARRAMARMIDTLVDADRFAVLAFDDRIETPLPGKPGRQADAGHRPEPVQGRRVPGESRVAGRHRDRRSRSTRPSGCSAGPATTATASLCWSPTGKSAMKTRCSRCSVRA